MTEVAYLSASAGKAEAGLLVLPVFEGPEPGPGVKEVDLHDAFAAAKLTGKKGETLLVPRRPGDGFAAQAVLLVGVGDRSAVDVAELRRAAGRGGAPPRPVGGGGPPPPPAPPGRPPPPGVSGA